MAYCVFTCKKPERGAADGGLSAHIDREKWDGKEHKMAESIIKKRHMDIGQAKDIENSLISQAKQEAIIEYIAICDHPEILEDEEEMEVEA